MLQRRRYGINTSIINQAGVITIHTSTHQRRDGRLAPAVHSFHPALELACRTSSAALYITFVYVIAALMSMSILKQFGGRYLFTHLAL